MRDREYDRPFVLAEHVLGKFVFNPDPHDWTFRRRVAKFRLVLVAQRAIPYEGLAADFPCPVAEPGSFFCLREGECDPLDVSQSGQESAGGWDDGDLFEVELAVGFVGVVAQGVVAGEAGVAVDIGRGTDRFVDALHRQVGQ